MLIRRPHLWLHPLCFANVLYVWMSCKTGHWQHMCDMCVFHTMLQNPTRAADLYCQIHAPLEHADGMEATDSWHHGKPRRRRDHDR